MPDKVIEATAERGLNPCGRCGQLPRVWSGSSSYCIHCPSGYNACRQTKMYFWLRNAVKAWQRMNPLEAENAD